MKAFRLVSTVLTLGIIFILTGCGSKGGASESIQDKQLGLLETKTWNVTQVSLGGVDQTSTWTASAFTLTVSGTAGSSTYNYTCAGRPSVGPWKASGTWTFDTTHPDQTINRDDGAICSYTVTATPTASLQISFQFTGTGYTNPRASNVSGLWVFTFN